MEDDDDPDDMLRGAITQDKGIQLVEYLASNKKKAGHDARSYHRSCWVIAARGAKVGGPQELFCREW